ncbi:diacylglycerol kinase family protein [Rhodobacter ferrooxidans]|uniref:Diacylglycerol kinase n=1 Tax=Rhodobacter ferrooxidans TaxID=371731 RepID=C8S3J8_9RHOB|nr:diacylglycerol kinase family protein [Rhodobacter sp. SW2]EEW24446.1 diacylglycerol kinase [Rhodobacter sp. SW2]
MRRLVQRLVSFKYAGRGVWLLFREANARIHLAATLLVILLGLFLRVQARDWALLTICITVVLAAEAINTAVERVVDLVSPEWSALARDAKDLAAGCVLIAAIGAAIVGLTVFLPFL